MSTIPNITVTGWSNSGKTTFVTQVVKILADSGIKVAVIKHHGHAPGGVDQEGKDSWKYEQAGANPVILSSSAQYAVFVSTPDHEPTREELMERLPGSTELVVIEGFRSEAEGAVEVSRKATGKGPKLSPEERIALISSIRPGRLRGRCALLLQLRGHRPDTRAGLAARSAFRAFRVGFHVLGNNLC